MQIYILHMINKLRLYLFDLYIELLNSIQRHTSAEQRVLLLAILCMFTTYVKVGRVLLYYLKAEAAEPLESK
jgi:hypothetical protein